MRVIPNGRGGFATASCTPMTTEQPTSPRLLRRRTDERVIGGVASGLGEFLNVDPLLVRIGFVGLMVFGGLGLLLYVGGWLLVPEDGDDDSIVEDLLKRTGLTPMRWLVLLLFALGLLIFLGGVGSAFGYYNPVPFWFGLTLMAVVLGGALLSYSGRFAPVSAPRVEVPRRPRESVSRSVAAPRHRRRQARSPLGWYVLGAMLASIGLLALATNVSGTDVDLGQYFGVAMAVAGVGLVVGTWWGHARLLILLGLLILPFAITASFVTAPIEGGIGSHQFSPTTADELQGEYRLLGGQMFLDLTGMEAGDEPIVIEASVTLGGIYVELPPDAGVVLDVAVGAGDLRIMGAYQAGTDLVDRLVSAGDGPTFVLDLEAGIGGVQVEAPRMEGH
jgi:phage shock protein PspC (stress-responsive transcriptional regulator)